MRIQSFVISLADRKDRLQTFRENNEKKTKLKINKFDAVNGYNLTCTNELLKLFEDNDFKMRAGVVGCALSHLQLYINLAESDEDAYVIFEDDAILLEDFDSKLDYALSKATEFDVMYLGHHPKNKDRMERNLRHLLPKTKAYNSEQSFKKSIGGLFSYVITKNAARTVLCTINDFGLKCGIDTFFQYMSNTLRCVYCAPFLSYSKCYRPGQDVDSDIQYNYTPIVNIDDCYILCSVYRKIERIKSGTEFTLEYCIKYIT